MVTAQHQDTAEMILSGALVHSKELIFVEVVFNQGHVARIEKHFGHLGIPKLGPNGDLHALDAESIQVVGFDLRAFRVVDQLLGDFAMRGFADSVTPPRLFWRHLKPLVEVL